MINDSPQNISLSLEVKNPNLSSVNIFYIAAAFHLVSGHCVIESNLQRDHKPYTKVGHSADYCDLRFPSDFMWIIH